MHFHTGSAANCYLPHPRKKQIGVFLCTFEHFQPSALLLAVQWKFLVPQSVNRIETIYFNVLQQNVFSIVGYYVTSNLGTVHVNNQLSKRISLTWLVYYYQLAYYVKNKNILSLHILKRKVLLFQDGFMFLEQDRHHGDFWVSVNFGVCSFVYFCACPLTG